MRASRSSVSLFFRSCSMALRHVFMSWLATAALPGRKVACEDPAREVLAQSLDVPELAVGLALGGPGRHPPPPLRVLRGVGPAEAVRPRSGPLAALPAPLDKAAAGHQRVSSPAAMSRPIAAPGSITSTHPPSPLRPSPSRLSLHGRFLLIGRFSYVGLLRYQGSYIRNPWGRRRPLDRLLMFIHRPPLVIT
jgi:hypothetical protein